MVQGHTALWTGGLQARTQNRCRFPRATCVRRQSRQLRSHTVMAFATRSWNSTGKAATRCRGLHPTSLATLRQSPLNHSAVFVLSRFAPPPQGLDMESWPGGIRQQFGVALPLVERLLSGLKQAGNRCNPSHMCPPLWLAVPLSLQHLLSVLPICFRRRNLSGA